MSIAISVENLSKKYLIKSGYQEPYKTLRDTITNSIKQIFSSNKNYLNHEEFWALKNINFDIEKGDRIAIIGKNGAGKSTLLKVLSRITSPSEGIIKIKGKVSSLLEVGTGFHPELTGRENIYLNGAILGMTKKEIKNKFDEIVYFSEIEKFLDTAVKRYSSGMYIRLAFSVSASLDTDILIIDEVLAVGDAQFQKKCLGKMKDISGEGRTILFVSHSMGAVSSLCNKGIILSKGEIIGSGNTEKIISEYLSLGNKLKGQAIDQSDVSSNKKLKIRKVSILDKNNNLKNEFSTEQKIFIDIEIEIIKPGTGYAISFEIIHFQYGSIFTSESLDYDIDKGLNKYWSKGNYKFNIELPVYLLRGGDYTISVASAIPMIEILDLFSHEVSFNLLDTSSPESKLLEGRRGSILPILKWNIYN